MFSFFGDKSNSRYYFHISCLKKADSGFVEKDLVIAVANVCNAENVPICIFTALASVMLFLL